MSKTNSKQKRSLVSILRLLVYLLTVLCFLVLAFTGFYPSLILGEHISGYPVMIHATFAPVFAVCLAVLAVMWARNCRFVCGDWPWFEHLVQRVTLVGSDAMPSRSTGLGQKIAFWLIIVLSLPLILSIVLSMFPFFGTHWQELLLNMHGFIAILFSLVAIVHTILLIRARAK